MVNIAKELRKLRKRTGLSMEGFARKLGYKGASSYQRYETVENYADDSALPFELGNKLISRIVAKKMGQPPITKSEVVRLMSLHLAGESIDSVQPESQAAEGFALIPEVEIRPGSGGGGWGEIVNQEEDGVQVSADKTRGEWGVPIYYLQELGVSKQGLYFFRNIGDSMTNPDGTGIHSGDVILANTNDKSPSPPGIFALWDGLGTVVKRIEYIMNSDPPRIKIKSDNPKHENYERTAEEVKIIGRCVWFGRQL